MSSRLDQLRREVQRLKIRESELLQAKSRLEKNQRINRAELEKVCSRAKEEGRRAVIEKLKPILPPSNSTFIQGAARVLTRDVKKIIDEYKK